MTGVGVFGLILGLVAGLRAFAQPTRMRVVVFILLYLLHVGASLLYWRLAQGTLSDAEQYYYDWLGLYEEGFGLSSAFVIYVIHSIREVFGGTYLDFFLFFQAFGFWGLVVMMRIIEEVYQDLALPQPIYAFALLFLPSLSYWSAAIGKDAPHLFGAVLCIWALMRFKERLPALIIGMALLVLIRPHVAAITLVALSFSLLRGQELRPWMRVGLMFAATGGLAVAVVAVRATFQTDMASLSIFNDVLAGRENILQSEESGSTAVDASYPVRVFSMLFRPLFFDAKGAVGLVVSAENALLLLLVGFLIIRARTVAKLTGSVLFVRYALVSSLAILLLQAVGYYNVGLGLRQKAVMVLPGLLLVLITVMATLSARREQLLSMKAAAPNAKVPALNSRVPSPAE